MLDLQTDAAERHRIYLRRPCRSRVPPLNAQLIPLQRARFVICLTAAPISALKTAVRQNPLSLSCSGFRFGSGGRQRSRCRIFRGTIRNLLPSRESLQNALGIFGRRDETVARPNHFSDRRIPVACDGKKNFDCAQYFDRTCCNFFAPSGGCTLPERMSFAATGLP